MAMTGWRIATSMVLLVALSACGFHLRGVQPGVAGLVVQIDSSTPYGELEQELASALRQADITVAEGDVSESAGMIVQLRNERLMRRVQTVNTTGRASDYELVLTVDYALAAPAAITDSRSRTLDARREYNYNNEELLGKAEEEALLVQEMRRDIAARLLRQIAYQAADAAQAN